MKDQDNQFQDEVAQAEAAASEKKAKKAKKVKTASDIEAPEQKERKATVRINKDAVISLKVEANPKRLNSKSYDRFNLYVDGQTVGEFLTAGGTATDVAYDLNKGHIELDRPIGLPKAEEAQSEAA